MRRPLLFKLKFITKLLDLIRQQNTIALLDFLTINSFFFSNSLNKQNYYISDFLKNEKLINFKQYNAINIYNNKNKFIANKFLKIFLNKLIIKYNIYINDIFSLLSKNIDNIYSLYLYYIDINRLYFLDNAAYLDYFYSLQLNTSSSIINKCSFV